MYIGVTSLIAMSDVRRVLNVSPKSTFLLLEFFNNCWFRKNTFNMRRTSDGAIKNVKQKHMTNFRQCNKKCQTEIQYCNDNSTLIHGQKFRQVETRIPRRKEYACMRYIYSHEKRKVYIGLGWGWGWEWRCVWVWKSVRGEWC